MLDDSRVCQQRLLMPGLFGLPATSIDVGSGLPATSVALGLPVTSVALRMGLCGAFSYICMLFISLGYLFL